MYNRFFIISSLFCGLLFSEVSYADSKSPSKDVFFFQGQSIRNVLTKYADSNGLKIVFGSSAGLLNKTVSGQFSVSSNVELLNLLAKQNGFRWFVYSGTLYITSTQVYTKNIEVKSGEIGSVRAVLDSMGLLDPQFGFSELPAKNLVVISGPLEYVNLLATQIKSLDTTPDNQQFAVYRLKYASADDTKFTFNNQQVVIPGVASMLQNTLKYRLNSLNGSTRLASEVSNGGQNIESSTSSRADISSPIIQSDSRLNTIIVRDKASNLKVYENLIATIDVPAPLIQVEVSVIHLDQYNLEQAGVNWQGYYGNVGASYNYSGSGGGQQGNVFSFYNQLNPGQLLVTNFNNFMASLHFFNKIGVTKVTSSPSLATVDNIPAIMSSTETMYLNQNPLEQNLPNYSFNQAQVTTALQITPHVINNDGKTEVKLDIVLMDGSIIDTANSIYPTTKQFSLNSQAVIGESQSLLLAGYTRDEHVKMEKGVPVLSSIPILGWFFKFSSEQTHKVTTIYLVTPRIITNKSVSYQKYKLVNNLNSLKDKESEQ